MKNYSFKPYSPLLINLDHLSSYRWLIPMVFFILGSYPASAQDSKGSLEQAMQWLEEADSFNLAVAYDSAEVRYKAAREIFVVHEDWGHSVEVLNKLSELYFWQKKDSLGAAYHIFAWDETKQHLPITHPQRGTTYLYHYEELKFLANSQEDFLASKVYLDSAYLILENTDLYRERIACYLNIVGFNSWFNDFEGSHDLILKAYALKYLHLPNDFRLECKILDNIIFTEKEIHNYESSIQAGNKIMEIMTGLPDSQRVYSDTLQMVLGLNGLSLIYDIKDDPYKSRRLCQEALHLINSNESYPNIYGVAQHRRIAKQASELGDYREALDHYLEIEKLLPAPSNYEECKQKYVGLVGIGYCYSALEKKKEALKYLEKVEEMRKQFPPQSMADLGLAKLHRMVGNHEPALKYYRKVKSDLKSGIKIPIIGGMSPGTINMDMAHVFFYGLNEIDSALIYAQKMIATSCSGVSADDPSSNPSSLDNILNLDAIFPTFFHRGIFQESKANTNPDGTLYFKLARESYLLCTQIIEKMREEGINTIEIPSFIESQFRLYERVIRTQLQQFQVDGEQGRLETAFIHSERSKGFLLMKSQAEKRTFSEGAIPKSLREEEQRIDHDLAFYSGKVREEKSKGSAADSTKLATWERITFDLERDKKTWEAEVSNKYPAYLRRKNRSFDIHPQQVQDSLLEEGEILIEYMLGEEDLYTFVISATDLKTYRHPLTGHLDTLVADYKRSVSDHGFVHDSTAANYEMYYRSAFGLYDILLGDPLKDFPATEKLLIVPDGILHQIPFEALLCEKPNTGQIDFLGLPYLIKRHPIRYGHSAALLLEALRFPESNPKEGVLAFAPSYGHNPLAQTRGKFAVLRDNNTPLKGARKEIESIANMGLKGQFLFGPSADEGSFKQLAPHYSIIHLAMHGQADMEDPLNATIRFTPSEKDSLEDQILHAYELQALPMLADLAVLSSCESGTGQFLPGEGVMSLSRHFMASGVRSVVSSLWKVDDAASANLMEFFYEELEEGESSADALYNAKIRFLQQADSRLAHPYYWASFLAHGDEKPAPFSKKPTPWVWLGVVAMAGLLWGIQRKGNLGFRKNKRGHAA